MATRATAQEEMLSIQEKLILTGQFIKIYWKILFAITWALILIPPLLAYNYPETRCAYTVLVMAGYWITECFPMAVTSLIPLVLFPIFGTLSTADTCACYMNDTIMVFIGGLVLAVAIEHSNLHLRIALGVMRTVGCTHGKLLGGLCVVTTFISMWVSNTAATAMMVPIIFAVLNELEQAGLCHVFEELPSPPGSTDPPEREPTKITKAYLMAAAYCSTFGGTGTLVGTGTNLTFKGIFESTFPGSEGISFTHWMIAQMPQMIINAFLTWLYLQLMFMGLFRPHSKDAQIATIGTEGETITNQVIQERYKELGDITFHEAAVSILFITCIFLWLFRKPGFIRGWSEAITEIDVRDSTPVIFISIMMFFIPKNLDFLRSYNKDPGERPVKSSEGLITWDVIQRKMPWSLMFLLGGGFAISRGSIASGLAKKVGETLVPLRYLPPVLIMLFVCLFIGTITEFTSNVGIANITLPVVAQMCVAMEIHPMYLMVPAAISCSYSFRLPVGTPPNAIISVVGQLPTKWLIIGGCGPSIFSLIVNVICFAMWGTLIFDVKGFPDWAKSSHPAKGNP
ncbi:protein I'm not dead yet [Bombus terrestris]|uniref:Protein I'm not dead yet n=1 Tax=Bombus terrestris TaxID=30195 RepID=A0A9B7CZC9_BOMTE|nr:protein I'm not dead yet [Bombus terrestris]